MASTIDERPPHMQKKRKKKRKNVLVKEREFLLGLEYTHTTVCVLVQTHMTQKVRSKGGRITILLLLLLPFFLSFEQFRVLLNASSVFFFFSL